MRFFSASKLSFTSIFKKNTYTSFLQTQSYYFLLRTQVMNFRFKTKYKRGLLYLATVGFFTIAGTITYSASVQQLNKDNDAEISPLEYEQLNTLMTLQSNNMPLIDAVSNSIKTHNLITKDEYKKILDLKIDSSKNHSLHHSNLHITFNQNTVE